jgi:hypothetical protein
MRAPLAMLFALVTGCHSGEPRGTEAPADPIVGMWRGADQGAALVLFSTLGEYRAVGIQIAGVTHGRWRRYSQSDIVLETESGAAFAVSADFDARRDRVTLSWSTIIPIDEPFPLANEVVLVRTSMMDAVDGGGGADGSVPASLGTP